MEIRDTLLLVNDDRSSRSALQAAFEKNYNLLEAENGEQALLLLEENHGCIAAVLLDTLMPVKSGYEALSEMVKRGLTSELPILIVTDENIAEQEARLFDLGVCDVITAPFDLYVIQRRVANAVNLYRDRWQLETILKEQSRLPQHSNEAMVDALTSIIEYRSPESGQHIPRIRQFTQILAEEVARSCPEYRLTPEAIALISSAATFHDIGKISVPDMILNKPERLTADEMIVMQTHSIAGCRILESIRHMIDPDYLRCAHEICRYHHERWDGGGYPAGLKGDDIPISAQIVGLVDVYDALTSSQVYKPAYPHGLAMNMILNGDCGAFSPKLLECLKQVSDQLSDITRSFEEARSQTSDRPAAPLPGPAPQDGPDTLQSIQMKYRALLYHLDATVMEVDLDNNFYHLVYNTNPCFSFLSSESSVTDGIEALLRQIVPPEELDETSALFSSHIRNFIEEGLRKQTRSYELYSTAFDQRQRYEFTFLRVEPLESARNRLLVICQPVSAVSSALPTPEKANLRKEDIFRLLAGVYSCRNDLWLTLEGDCDPLASLLGYSESELQSRFQNRLMNLVLPEDRQMIRRRMAEQLTLGRNIELEYRLRRKDGQVIWVLNKGHLVIETHGVERLYCVLVDITQTKQTLDHLQQSLERHQIIMAQTDDIVFEWDMVGDTVTCTNKWQALFGYEPLIDNFSRRINTSSHFHPDDLPLFLERVEALKSGSDYQETELRIAKSDGRYLWCRFRATAQYGADGMPFRAVGVIINIDAEKRAALALQSRAEQDPLTKLLNKNASRQQVETRLLNRRPDELSALLIIDLDNFKQVNDQHGHLFGDSVLTQAAAEFRRFFRSEDIISRIGGDEFLIYMSNIPNRELVERRCSGMLESFHSIFRDRLEDVGLSCSVGVALAPEHGISYQELFQRADLALYRAKAHGKNCCAFYDSAAQSFLSGAKPTAVVSTTPDTAGGITPSEYRLLLHAFHRLYESGDHEDTLRSILQAAGQQAAVSRVYLMESDPGGQSFSNTFEWCSPGTSSAMASRQGLRYKEDLPDFDVHFNARGIFSCPDISILPPVYANRLAASGIRSVLQCAIREGGVIRGYVGFDACGISQNWTTEQTELLCFLSGLCSVIQSKQKEKE